MEGNVQTEYASLSGKIHTIVIDKTLSISGACADAKATGDRLEKMQDTIDNFDAVTDEEVQEMVDNAVSSHANNTDNPHKVTAEQVGAYSKEEADKISVLASYLSLAGNVNAEMTTAALGKNNESRMKGVGKALAMYAWYKGETHEFNDLQKCDNLNDVAETLCADEIWASPALSALVKSNTYANDKLATLQQALSLAVGRSVDSVKEVALNASYMQSFFANYTNGPTFNVDITGWNKTNAGVSKESDRFYAYSSSTGHKQGRVEKNFGTDLTDFVAIFNDQTATSGFNDHHPMRFANTTTIHQYYNDDGIANGFTIQCSATDPAKMYIKIGPFGTGSGTGIKTDEYCVGTLGEDILVVCSGGVVSTYSASAGYKTFTCDTVGIQQAFIGLAAYDSTAKVYVKCMFVD